MRAEKLMGHFHDTEHSVAVLVEIPESDVPKPYVEQAMAMDGAEYEKTAFDVEVEYHAEEDSVAFKRDIIFYTDREGETHLFPYSMPESEKRKFENCVRELIQKEKEKKEETLEGGKESFEEEREL